MPGKEIMADYLTKNDVQRWLDGLDDEVMLCPDCKTEMKLFSDAEGQYWGCCNRMCLNEDRLVAALISRAG